MACVMRVKAFAAIALLFALLMCLCIFRKSESGRHEQTRQMQCN